MSLVHQTMLHNYFLRISQHFITNLLKEEKKQATFLKIKKQEPTFVTVSLIQQHACNERNR